MCGREGKREAEAKRLWVRGVYLVEQITGEAETVVVRAVRRNAVVMKAVPQRMDRVKEEGTERAW